LPPPPPYQFPPQTIITWLAIGTVIVAFLVGYFRNRTPAWLTFLLDLLPIPWIFPFAWSLVHEVSDLIPARKHPPFANNALAAAGIMTLVAALIPGKWRGRGVGALGVVLSGLAMADILHMRIFGNVMPVGSHGSITQLWDVRASIVSLFEKHDAWIALYLATALAMLLLFRTKNIQGLLAFRILAYIVPIAALSPTIKPVKKDVSEFLESKWAKEVLNREDQVWNAGFLEAHIREISLNIKHELEHRKPTARELEQAETYYRDEHAAHVTTDRPSFGQWKGKNLLVIQIEAFEEWLIGATVSGQEITPTLNRLREHAVYYPNIFNQVATTPTADCEYLFLNSNHPLPDGAVAFRREDNHFVTIATQLRDAGYSTVSMHGYRKGMWNRAVVHPRYGFTHSLFSEEIGMKPEIGWGLDDHVLMDRVAEQTEKEKAPWFIYAITLSSHHPYNAIPYNRRRLKLGGLDSTMVGQYMHSAAFVDDALGELFAKLEKSGVLKDTIVVMYGDHDGHLHATREDRQNIAKMTNLPPSKWEYIGAGGSATANDKTDATRFWYRNRIPLFILLPGQEKPVVARAYGAQIDFAPTLLHYFGIDPPRSFIGHAILPEDIGGFVARWDGSFVSPPLIYEAGIDQCRELEDLRGLPSEKCRPLADKARRELEMSWLLTNNDLAHLLVEHAKPLVPTAPRAQEYTLGAACHDETECKVPAGYQPRCLGGVCMSDPKGPCDKPESTAPCPWGSACFPLQSDLNVCAAECDVFRCAGECDPSGVCVGAKGGS
jgi:phosphoglycerol transferase MdoB-like AlkP superfamily enzyme